MKKRKLKAIDLFAGAGGFSLGLQQAGIDVVAAVEIDKFCVDTGIDRRRSERLECYAHLSGPHALLSRPAWQEKES